MLDAELRPVPPGERGEIYVGGQGLARGVWRQPALTARQFLPDPYGSAPGTGCIAPGIWAVGVRTATWKSWAGSTIR